MLPCIEKFSSKRKDYLVRMFMKGKSYLLKAATVLKKYDLPIVDRKKAGADARNEYLDYQVCFFYCSPVTLKQPSTAS